MSNKLPLILLPPSEGKASGGLASTWEPDAMKFDLDAKREVLIDALGRAMALSEPERSKLLGVKGDALLAATQTNLSIRDSQTLPAIQRYTGVLYEALDIPSLSGSAKRRLKGSVVILSGLWGLVAPDDRIPDYKLKMGSSLAGIGRLSTFWRDDLSISLSKTARGRRVWNLLPKEHDSALRSGDLPDAYAAKFVERKADGSLVTVSHWNKLLKGALVRFLLENPDADPHSLEAWDHPLGYQLDRSQTEDGEGRMTLVFVRNGPG